MDKCLQSAYDDLQLMIEEVFINVKEIPNQLSYEEFATLFTKQKPPIVSLAAA